MKLIALFLGLSLLTACGDVEPSDTLTQNKVNPTSVAHVPIEQGELHTDTLQYLHFEGNFDYWYGVFINSRKDTVQLVLTEQPPVKYRNKLVEVKWLNDTLEEAGDSGSPYAAKRLKQIRLVGGKTFDAPVNDEKVIKDIKSLPEVQANADQVGIAARPTDDEEYYLVEAGTRNEDNYSRIFMFRVYVYPKYEIKIFDAGADKEMTLSEWRKQQN